MWNFLLRLNITQKYIAFLVLISILPMLVVGVTAYQVSRNVLREEASRYMFELVHNQKDYLEEVLKQAEDLMRNISSVEAIVESLDDQQSPAQGYDSLATQARIGYILNNYSSLEGLVSIDIFTLGGAHYHVGDTLDVSAIRADLQTQMYQEAQRGPRRIVWMGIEDNVNVNSGFRKVITAATVLSKTDLKTLQSKPVALLLVNYSTDYLYEHFSEANLGKGAYLMVIDAKNRIIYHPDKSLHGAWITPEFIQKLTGEQGSFIDSSSGQRIIVTYSRSELSGWVVLGLVPVDTLLAGTIPIGKTTLEVLILSFLMVVFSSFIVEAAMVKPIQEITQRFRGFQDGTLDLKERLPVGKLQDEIGDLLRWFNTFLETMQARQQAETALLESRERYSLALRGANDGIWDWNLREDSIHYSSRWKEMLGLPEDSALSGTEAWFGRVHPDDAQRLQDEIAAHLDGKTHHFESEHRLLMQDGRTYRWFLARGMAVSDTHFAPASLTAGAGSIPAGAASIPVEKMKPHRMAGSLTDITERKSIEERLTYDAMHDPLTHLYNRVFFIAQLRHAIDYARRHPDYRAAVMFLDMDRFKIVNDSLGHVYGDQLLTTIAHRLNECLRSVDTIARFGGDEFVILIDDIEGLQQAVQVANRLQEKLSEPFKLQGQDIFMTVSIGITVVTAHYQQPEEVLRDADTAMYRAKANGRDGYELFGPEMHDNSVALLRLEADLRRAIERQEFLLYYQPILSLQTGAVTGVEALLRWQHPERGLIPPDAFINLAEDTGMIVPIGEWVLNTACGQLKMLHRAGFPDLRVQVNISARQIQSSRLPELVQSLVQDPEIGSAYLGLEITENMAMADLAQTTQALAALKAMGISISIDDFGTIYSSLGYLKRLPVNCIKIDRAFIKDCAVNTDDAAITTAIIAMGHILELNVIAEGVEDIAQMAFLRAQHCDGMQGYLLSRPVPLEALLETLKNDLPAFQREHFTAVR